MVMEGAKAKKKEFNVLDDRDQSLVKSSFLDGGFLLALDRVCHLLKCLLFTLPFTYYLHMYVLQYTR